MNTPKNASIRFHTVTLVGRLRFFVCAAVVSSLTGTIIHETKKKYYDPSAFAISLRLQRNNLPLTNARLDDYFLNSVEPSTAAILAGSSFYKEREFFTQGHFTPNYGSWLKVLAGENRPSKDGDPALDLEDGRLELGKLMFGYNDQVRTNMAFKFLMRHALLFQINRKPDFSDPKIRDFMSHETLESWKAFETIPYERQYISELTELAMQAMVKEAAVDGNNKQNLFARRVETGLLEDEGELGITTVNGFFKNLDLADKIKPERFVEFFISTGLDQSKRLRTIISERAKTSPLYSAILDQLPPITEPVVPIDRYDIIRPRVGTSINQEIAEIDAILRQLDQLGIKIDPLPFDAVDALP